MTRMFLRFYLGVLLILLLAWGILAYVYRARSEAKNIRVVELALGGGTKLAREKLDAATGEAFDTALNSVRMDFDYPVNVVTFLGRPMGDEQSRRLVAGEPVFYGRNILVALADRERLIEFGPLPAFAGPDQREVVFGVGAILSLTAISIAILLRPVAIQLRSVERTATAISAGDLSARINTSAAPKGLAFALAFNKMADRVETLLRIQRELLQAVSHELRTPLAKIRFAADLIETAATKEERRRRLDAVDDATQKLDDLVGELLDYVRLESVVAEAEVTRCNVHALIAELLDTHASLNPSVRCSMAAGDEVVSWYGDRKSISVAIGNLISNAVKFAASEVQVAAYQQAGKIIVEVDDDGPGISESDRERVFEPFVKLSLPSERGVGLGLALVNRIATRCGGTVSSATSSLGGTTFKLSLPSAPIPADS